MARTWRYIVSLSCSVAIALPVQLDVNIGSHPEVQLRLSPASARAGGGDNGSSGETGNSGNGNGRGSDSKDGRGNPGNGNGNAGESRGNSGGGSVGSDNGNNANGGTGGERGGNAGNSGNKGSEGQAGNSGGGRSGSNSGSRSPGAGGAGADAGGNSGQNSSGSRGNSGENGSRSGNQGAEGKAGSNSSGNRAAAGSGNSNLGAGKGRQATQNVPVLENTKAQRSAKAKQAPATVVKGAAPSKRNQGAAATRKVKSSLASQKSRARKTSPSQGNETAHPGSHGSGVGVRSTASPIAFVDEEGFAPLGSASKPRQAPRSIIVSGLSERDIDSLAASGLRATEQTAGSLAPRIVRLNLPAGMSLVEARRRVQRVSIQASTDFDTYYYVDGGSTSCSDPGCQASTLVGWSPPRLNQCQSQATVGLIDTGIDLGHEALTGQAIEVVSVTGASGERSSKDHGTAIAALLVGRPGGNAPGLMPQAKLVAVDAFVKGIGAADRADVISLVKALEALAERGVKVINLSLSGPPNDMLKAAVEAAQAQGITLVAAAGNNGAAAEPSYPAAYPGVVAVTAVDRDLKVYRRATHGQYITFAAPGVEIQTAKANGGTTAKSGTSYAVPFVAAAMTLVQASHKNIGRHELQKKLQDETRDLGIPGHDETYGYGLVQMSNLCDTPEDPIPVAGGAAVPQDDIELQ